MTLSFLFKNKKMKSKEEVRKFILDTLLPYKEDENLIAYDKNQQSCMYLTSDGRKCAVGKHMRKGEWQSSFLSAVSTFNKYSKEQVLTPEAFNLNLEDSVWDNIQSYHDLLLKRNKFYINSKVKTIEKLCNIKLPELKIE